MDFERHDLENIIKHSTVTVLPGLYAIAKSTKIPETPVFCMASDEDEVTIIVEESHLNTISYDEMKGGFRLVEIRVALPFLAIGFLAKITATVAQQDQNVLVISTYSKDYLLIRDEGSEKVKRALSDVGFIVA